jgi:hypothetical protein
VEVIHIDACPDDLNKLVECVATFGQPSFVWRQVARDDVWKWTWPGEGAEIPAAAQIGCRIDCRRLTEVRVSTGSKLGGRASAMATIAVCLSVDNVATESHQCPVFSSQVQWNWGYCETLLNL